MPNNTTSTTTTSSTSGGTASTSGKLAKAIITDLVRATDFQVMFNPNEYTLSKSVSYSETTPTNVNTTYVNFIHGNKRQLTMDLFFDTTDIEGDENSDANVMKKTTAIEKLMDAEITNEGEYTPPMLEFKWGPFRFKCVLKDVVEQFTKFDQNGVPKRAILRCTFDEFCADKTETKKVAQNTTSEAGTSTDD